MKNDAPTLITNFHRSKPHAPRHIQNIDYTLTTSLLPNRSTIDVDKSLPSAQELQALYWKSNKWQRPKGVIPIFEGSSLEEGVMS